MAADHPSDGQREVFFEFTVVGSVVRVAAVDSLTALEVVVMGPVSASRADLQQLALAKLKARLAAEE
ncbi:MAG TPA: serine hydroxymethyltransferase [Pseudolabrys sp.]|nr:serine hydroxymethyltransferase [Pseudolabrys sp.]